MIGLSGDDTNSLVIALCEHLFYMLRMTGTPLTLAEAGVSRESYEAVKPAIIEAALKDACTATNPRRMTPEGVEEILSKLL